MKNKQVTLAGDDIVNVTNKKILSRNSGINFYNAAGEKPEDIIEALETVHHRTRFYALTSGGKDSVSLAHWLSERDKLDSIVHIKTNIGLQSTVDFVHDLAQEQGWKLHVIEPQPKMIYSSFVLQYGFPGPGAHRMVMGVLKYKTMRDFALSADRQHHCLISGVRKFESTRRLGNYPRPIQQDGALWFGCPFFYKKSEELYEYIHTNGLRITPASKILGTSGDCMCGAYATRGEKQSIREMDPHLADYIEWLEDGIQRFGTPYAKKFPRWGGQAKMSDMDQQQQIDGFFDSHPDLKSVNDMESLVCGEECGAGTMRGMVDY